MSFLFNLLRRREPLKLSPRVIHWVQQAPTFALLDTDDEALAVAHSLDSIIQGREHIQAHVLLLRDRVAQDQARIIELEALMAETSRAVLKRDEEGSNGSPASVSSPASTITDNARAAYRPSGPMAPLPYRDGKGPAMKLADAGEALKAAVRSM